MERTASANTLRFGLYEADPGRNALTRNGVRVKIQDQPFRVLLLLLERPGEIVTREELRQKLWPDGTFVEFDGSLSVTLKRLRAAIDDDSENPRYIETVPRHGYRFIAPVSAGEMKGATSAPSQTTAQFSDEAKGGTPVPPSKATHGRGRLILYTVSALLLLVAIGTPTLLWRVKHSLKPRGTLSQTGTAAVNLRKSIAVLGFRSVSGRVDEAWMATAFSEMLSTELAGGDRLRLVSGEDVANLRRSFPWSQTDTLDQETTGRIGTALNSDLLVLGSYTTIGTPARGQLRIDVRLQDAKTGEILTEIAETGDVQNLFHLISHVGGRL
jgi:DNA-binding winged helix-turn-helix (wHTH) protein/TolB-like protein